METKRCTIYIDPALLDRLKKIAKKQKRSVNSEINYLIEQYVEQHEKGT